MIEVQGQAEASGELDRFDSALAGVDSTAQRTSVSTAEMGKAMGQAALGITTAATSALSLWTNYTDLDKQTVRVTSAEKSRDTAQRQLIEAQAALDKLTEQGITTGERYESAVLRLSAAQQGLQIAEEKVKFANDDLQNSQLRFALSVLPTVMGAVQGVSSAMTAFRTIQGLTSAAQAATTATTAAQSVATGGLTVVTGGAAAATGGLSLGMRLLQLAMGPVGWITLGIATVLGLYATNAWGARDAMDAVGEAVGNALPFLRPLLEMLSNIANTIFPNTKDEAKSMETGVNESLLAMGHEFDDYVGLTTVGTDTVIRSYAEAQNRTVDSMNAMREASARTAGSISADAGRIEAAMHRIASAGANIGAVGPSIDAIIARQFAHNPEGAWTFGLTGRQGSPASSPPVSPGSVSVTVQVFMDSKKIAEHMGNGSSGDILKFV